MNRYLPIGAALVVIALGTYFQGRLTDRWGMIVSGKLESFNQRVENVPLKLGDWVGEDTEVNQRLIKASNCTAYLSRVYRHSRTGEEVSVFLVCGTSRHVTIHTPTWCNPAAGFKIQQDPHSYRIECGPEMQTPVFTTTTFRKEETTGTHHLRIFWSFAHDGRWEAPKYERTNYAGHSALYKVYFITQIKGRETAPEKSPSIEFVKDIMPKLTQILFPRNSPAKENAATS